MTQNSGTMEPPSEQPQRMSALYQYHNAPEVAPAHGLEYDDSNYPHSDKYPVIHSTAAYDSKWTNKNFAHDGKPPRIIFGMKVKTFLVVAAIMIMVIVGAAVGGAVGGSSIKNAPTPTGVITNTTSTSNTTSSTGVATATPTSFSAAVPSYTPINDCPQANNTLYSSNFGSGFAGAVQSGSQLNFTRYCDVASPLIPSETLISTYVYSFEDCIEACASLNFYNHNGACSLAAFQANGSRPTNCWVGKHNTTLGSLSAQTGFGVALLRTT